MSVYKNEKVNLLEKALDSILNQTQVPSEFVLIKDGLLTPELDSCIDDFCKKAKNKSLRVKILKNEKNLGLGKSLKRGVTECSYDWIARFDSDDINTPKRIEKCIEFIEHNQQIVIVGGYITEFSDTIDDPISTRKVPLTDTEIKAKMKTRNPFNHMSVFFEKKAILSAGNYQDVPYFEDYYLWLRLLNSGHKAANLPEVLVYAHVDNEFYNKRGGFQYLKKELHFQKLILKKKYISLPQYLVNVSTRGLIRVVPSSLLNLVYKLLRQ